jgi:hypothetical protein
MRRTGFYIVRRVYDIMITRENTMFYWGGGLGTVIIVLLILWLLGVI